jgi:hypothetical protein
MPKIVIKEYDKTKAGIGAYANFSVVVPGFLGTPEASVKSEEVQALFDENGIYECSSQTDFVKYVGKQSYKLVTDKTALLPIPPEVTLCIKLDPECVLSGKYTDGITYMVEDNSRIVDSAADRFILTYKDQALYSEALNAFYTNELAMPRSIDEVIATVEYLLATSKNYERPVEYKLAEEGITVTYPAEAQTIDEGEEGNVLSTVNVTVKVLTALPSVTGNSPLSAVLLELGYYTNVDGKISFTKVDLGSAEESFKTNSDGIAVAQIANSLDASKTWGVRIINKSDFDDQIIYPFKEGSYNLIAAAVESEEIVIERPVGSGVTDNYDLYVASVNPDANDVGFMRDAARIFIEANATTVKTAAPIVVKDPTELDDGSIAVSRSQYKFDQANAYYIIGHDSKGDDGEVITEEIMHYGNQIAYELLGLGYTVLYKNLSLVNITDMIESVSLETVNKYLKEKYGAEATQYSSVPTTTDNPSTILQYQNDRKAAFTYYYCDTTADGTLHTVKHEYSSLGILGQDTWWECLKDKSTYDFRYLVTGLFDNNEAANLCISKIANHNPEATGETGRGDCIALLDIDRDCYSKVGRNTQKDAIPYIAREAAKFTSDGGKYAAVFAPTVTYTMVEDPDFGGNRTFPGSFHYLACAAKAAENYSEWYANAGYTRGVCDYTIEETGCKLGEVAVQALEPRALTEVGKLPDSKGELAPVNTSTAVNLIIKIKNNYYLWGNRTAHKLGTPNMEDGDLVASHFLNIRQLCTTIKKQVYVACRRFTFDPNSNVLWLNFCSAIRPTLEKMKADQGIKDYAILPEKTAQKGVLAAKIRIVPIEAVEDFYINLFLEDAITGPDAQVSESE